MIRDIIDPACEVTTEFEGSNNIPNHEPKSA